VTGPLVKYMMIGELPEDEKQARKIIFQSEYHILKEGVLYRVRKNQNRKSQLLFGISECKVLPQCLVMDILKSYHGFAHQGIQKMIGIISSEFWFENLYGIIKKFVGACPGCVKGKK